MESPRFPNKTMKFFYNLCLICYCIGLPNFWMDALPFPKRFDGFYRVYSRFITISVYVFILSEFASVFTQKNLTEKQESDQDLKSLGLELMLLHQMVYILSHPMLWSYSVIVTRHADKVRKILVDIMRLKEVYNDKEIEKKMMKKSKFYSTAFCGMCIISMSMYTIDSFVQCVWRGKTFTTVITGWPLVEDPSTLANIARFVWNLLWWWMMSRVLAVYAFVFSLICCMSHQYLDLHTYFLSLDKIFYNSKLSQYRKERKFEEAYKIGIKLHYDTIECVELCKSICGWLFSGQIIFNISMLVLLMLQLLKTEYNVMHVAAKGITTICIVLGTGVFMCSAGDITVEAAELSTAMHCSGWHNCRGRSSARVCKLVVTSMVYAQQPVVIKGLGIMSLSYQSYVSLVKSTYSVFSLILQQIE